MRSVIAILCVLIFSTCVDATTTSGAADNETVPEATAEIETQKIELIIPEKLFKELKVSARAHNLSLGEEIVACLEDSLFDKSDVKGSPLSVADMKIVWDTAAGWIYELAEVALEYNYMRRDSWVDTLNKENKEYNKWLSAKTKNGDGRGIKSTYEDTTVVESTDKKGMVQIHFAISEKILRELKVSAKDNNRSLKAEIMASLEGYFPKKYTPAEDDYSDEQLEILDDAVITSADKIAQELRFSSAASRERSLKFLNKLNQQYKESPYRWYD